MLVIDEPYQISRTNYQFHHLLSGKHWLPRSVLWFLVRKYYGYKETTLFFLSVLFFSSLHTMFDIVKCILMFTNNAFFLTVSHVHWYIYFKTLESILTLDISRDCDGVREAREKKVFAIQIVENLMILMVNRLNLPYGHETQHFPAN